MIVILLIQISDVTTVEFADALLMVLLKIVHIADAIQLKTINTHS